jgi:hypothetical protein
LVTGGSLLVTGVELEEKKEKKRPKGCEMPFYRLGTRVSDIYDRSDMSGLDRIYPTNSDLAEILQKTELCRIYPSWDRYI